MKPQDVKKEIDQITKNPPATGVYLFGEEEYIKRQMLMAIKEAVINPDFAEFNFDKFWGGDIKDPKEIFDSILALPMMTDRKLVIINDANKLPKNARDFLCDEKIPSSTMLIIESKSDNKKTAVHRNFSKKFHPIGCEVANDKEMNNWAALFARKNNLKMDAKTGAYLVSRVAINLDTLSAELEKFSLYDIEKLDVEIIDKMTANSRSVAIYRFSDCFASRDFRQTVILGNQLFQFGEAGTLLIAYLKTQLFSLLDIKANPYGGGAIYIPRWKLKQYKNWANRWSPTQIRDAISNLADADVFIKSGKMTEKQAVMWAIAKTAGKTRN